MGDLYTLKFMLEQINSSLPLKNFDKSCKEWHLPKNRNWISGMLNVSL